MNKMKNNLSETLAWVPASILFLLMLTLWNMVFTSGLPGEFAWYTLQIMVPVLGLIYFVVILVKIIHRKTFTRRLAILLTISILAILPVLGLFIPIPYPYFLNKAEPSATVRLPADGPLQVIWGGDTLKNNYHVVSPDQRWAYDFVVEPALHGSNNLEDYGCYGIPIVAPITGKIVIVHDGEPDEVPGVVSNNVEQPRGNFIALQMESKTYLLIGHMKPGSIMVAKGEMVQEGQVLGACGNSGNTSEPHIHIHHQRINPAEWPNGFGEGLPLYFRDQNGRAMPEGGFEMVDKTPVPLGPIITHRQ